MVPFLLLQRMPADPPHPPVDPPPIVPQTNPVIIVLDAMQVLTAIEETIDGLVALKTMIVPGESVDIYRRRDGFQALMSSLGIAPIGVKSLRIILVE